MTRTIHSQPASSTSIKWTSQYTVSSTYAVNSTMRAQYLVSMTSTKAMNNTIQPVVSMRSTKWASRYVVSMTSTKCKMNSSICNQHVSTMSTKLTTHQELDLDLYVSVGTVSDMQTRHRKQMHVDELARYTKHMHVDNTHKTYALCVCMGIAWWWSSAIAWYLCRSEVVLRSTGGSDSTC